MSKPPLWRLWLWLAVALCVLNSQASCIEATHTNTTARALLVDTPAATNASLGNVLHTIKSLLTPARALSDGADCTTFDCQFEQGVCLPRALVPADPANRCHLAVDNPACTDGNQFVEYLPLWFCSPESIPQWSIGVGLVVWSLLLFYCMSTVAEAFLVPAVQYMATTLRLPSDIAGITLFAFATGAPDIFTQLAAINEGQHVDIQLAVSSTLGSGLFIICIVLAVVLLLTPTSIIVQDTTSYVRDAAAYFCACLLVLIVMWDDSLHVFEALLMLACYVGYITCCLHTMRDATPRAHVGAGPFGELPQLGGGFGEPQVCVELSVVADGCAMTAPGSPIAAVHAHHKGDEGHFMFQHTSSSIGGGLGTRNSDEPSAGGVGRRRGIRSTSDAPSSVLPSPRTDTTEETNPLLYSPGTQQHSNTTNATLPSEPPTRKLSKPILLPPSQHHTTAQSSSPPRTILQHVEQLLHWHHTPLLLRPLALLCAPWTLIMHASMPSVHPGRYSRRYCIVLAVCAPLVLGLAVGAGDWRACNVLLAWAITSLLLLLLLLTTFRDMGDGRAQRANAVFSLLAFVQSMVWMSLLADEVAALFESLGMLLNLQADILGATLLAWGETLPDLVSSIAIVRTGHSMMAISAAFGGPTLNLLVGTGASVLCAILRKGTVPAELTNGVVVLVAVSMVTLFVVLAVPALRQWQLRRSLGWGLVVMYVVSLVGFLVSDSQLVVRHVSAHQVGG